MKNGGEETDKSLVCQNFLDCTLHLSRPDRDDRRSSLLRDPLVNLPRIEK